jgi:hypothetical protein
MPTKVTAAAAKVALELEGELGALVDKVSLPALQFPAAGQPTLGAFEARISATARPASACLRNPMICSSVNLLFLMSAILLVGGLLLLHVGTAGGEQVR